MGEPSSPARDVTIAVPDFTRNFMERLWHSFVDNYKVDVEITCHGHSVRAHQLVLALFCSTFKKTFDITDTGDHRLETKLLNFDQVVERGRDLELLIEFIYRGSITLPEDQLDHLRSVATTLEFELLLEAIERSKNPPIPSPSETAAPPAPAIDIPVKKVDQSEEEEEEEEDDDETAVGGSNRPDRRKRRKPIPRKLYLMNSATDSKLRGSTRLLSTTTPWTRKTLKRKGVVATRRLRAAAARTAAVKEKTPDVALRVDDEKVLRRETDCGDVDDPAQVEDENCAPRKVEKEETQSSEQSESEVEVKVAAQRRKRRKVAVGGGGGTGRRGRPPKGRAPRKQIKPRRKKLLLPATSPDDDTEETMMVGEDGEKVTRAEYKKNWRQSRPLLKCPQCNYETQDKESYRSHTAKHDPSVERFVCDICSKKFRSKRGFLCHCRGHQGPDNMHQCLRCPFQTPQKSSWTQHLAVIHKIDQQGNPLPEKYKCQECSYSCVADHKLKAHVMRKHTADKPFKCTECDYATFLKYDLEKHVIIRHRHERNYMCETCGFRSQTQSGYARHRRSHTGEKPFRCSTCGQVYADGRKLRIHLQRHLNDEKPFVCHLCGHSCRRKDNLQMHVRRIHKRTLDGDNALPDCIVVDKSDLGLVGDMTDAIVEDEERAIVATQEEIAAAMAAAASTNLEVHMRASAAAAASTVQLQQQQQHQQHFQHSLVAVAAASDCDKSQQEITFIVPSSVSLPINYMEYHVPI